MNNLKFKQMSHNENSRNFLAILFGMGSQILIQLISIPIFLHFLSISDFAIWIVAFNVAQFSNFMDLGTITSNQNLFPYLIKKGKSAEISKRISHNIFLISFNYLTLIVIFTLVVILFGIHTSFFLTICFGFSVYLQSVFGIIEAIKRMNGKNSSGLNLSSLARLVEFGAYTFSLVIGFTNLLIVGLTGLLSKFLLFCFVKLRDQELRLLQFFPNFDFQVFKEMIQNGIPYTIVKISDTISLSGIILVIHSKFSATSLLLFMSFRTFLRFGFQFCNLINFTFYFELSRNWANNSFLLFKKNVRINFLLSFAFGSVLVFLFTIFGDTIYSSWTHNKFSLGTSTLYCGIFYLFVMILSQSQKIQFHSVNANLYVSIISLLGSLFCIIYLLIDKTMVKPSQVFILLGFVEIFCILMIWLRTETIIRNVFKLHDEDIQ